MPSHPQPFVQALQYASQGAYPQAIGLFQQALAAQPKHFESRLQLAKACLDWVQALAKMPLTDIDPDKLTGEAAHYLMLAQSQLALLAKSHPASPHVQHLLAMVHLIYNRPADALACLKKALSKDPRNAALLYNQAYSMMRLERFPEAVKGFEKLVKFHPRHGMGWHMLGEARHAAGDGEAAIVAYRQAMVLLPQAPQVYGAMARAFNMLDRHAEAMDALRAGLVRYPNDQDMNAALAKLALSTADWDTGWRYYACRHSAGKRTPIPEGYVFEWQPDRPVRVRFDQGLGDELHFLRFLPALAAKGMTIHYSSHPKLLPLLQGQQHIALLNAATVDQLGEYDCLVGDLPWLAGMRTMADLPPPLPLNIDCSRMEDLRGDLTRFGPPPYLGVTWQGGREINSERKESWRSLYKEISPTLLGELACDWPGTVVVMQRVPKPADLIAFSTALGRPSLDWSALNDSLPEVLAGLSLLDEYVGVSNTNMHLLAGIGKSARVLVPHPADWRWMVEGDESPWFPGFGVYRQTRTGDWQPAFNRLRGDLARWNKAGVVQSAEAE
jgi:tetratricopeptide (TPR) repeat protein